jgi:protease IV
MANNTNEPQSSDESTADKPGWEREALIKLATAGVEEQRRSRRWGIFFKLLGFTYLLILLYLLNPLRLEFHERAFAGKHTALVDLEGVIAADSPASAENINAGLRAAFEDKRTAGVILRINSPGGSPVQAGQINDEIYRLRKDHPDIPLYAVVSDVCASGALYVAVAADRIYADKASLVGSIGVRMDSFGFVKVMQRLGVERRLYTAGAHKGLLDPFLPENPAEITYIKSLLNEIHNQFIAVVKRGRGDRLANDKELFSGLVWSGDRAKRLGLIDDLGSAGFVARKVIGASNIIDFTRKEDYLQWFAEHIGAAFAHGVETRLLQPVMR